MPKFTRPHPAAAPTRGSRPGRAARVAWRAGWILLAAVSLAVTYVLLVVAGR
jgi:hypothetical protein